MAIKHWGENLPIVRSRIDKLDELMKDHAEIPEGARERVLNEALGHANALANESRDLAKSLLDGSRAARDFAVKLEAAEEEDAKAEKRDDGPSLFQEPTAEEAAVADLAKGARRRKAVGEA